MALFPGFFVGLQRNIKGIENATDAGKAGVPHRAGGNKPAPGPHEQNTRIWGQENNHVELIFFGEALHISCV